MKVATGCYQLFFSVSQVSFFVRLEFSLFKDTSNRIYAIFQLSVLVDHPRHMSATEVIHVYLYFGHFCDT